MSIKKNLITVISAIMSLAVMITIFYYSSQPRGVSKSSSGKVADAIEYTLNDSSYSEISVAETDTDGVSSEKDKTEKETKSDTLSDIRESLNRNIRKAAHFIEFTALGFFLGLFFYEALSSRFSYFIAFLIGFLYAVSDEVHQFFVPGRGPSWKDIIIDGSGIVFGILLTLLSIEIAVKILTGKKNSKDSDNISSV